MKLKTNKTHSWVYSCLYYMEFEGFGDLSVHERHEDHIQPLAALAAAYHRWVQSAGLTVEKKQDILEEANWMERRVHQKARKASDN